MGARYKNGVPVPVTRWENSWAWQIQQERERKKESRSTPPTLKPERKAP